MATTVPFRISDVTPTTVHLATVLRAFQGVKKYGLPTKVRTNHGGENMRCGD